MNKIIARRAIGFAAGAVLYLCAAASMAQQAAPTERAAQIVIDGFAFAPASLTVAAGTRVSWLNKDEEPHTVMSADGAASFKSPALDTNDAFSFVFDKPGTYKYFCTLHAHMVGTIVVQ